MEKAKSEQLAQAPNFACFVVSEESEIPSWLGENDRGYLIDFFGEYDSPSVLVVKTGEAISMNPDGGEPEDQTFGRDLAWIEGAIKDAYECGKLEAIEQLVAEHQAELELAVDSALSDLEARALRFYFAHSPRLKKPNPNV